MNGRFAQLMVSCLVAVGAVSCSSDSDAPSPSGGSAGESMAGSGASAGSSAAGGGSGGAAGRSGGAAGSTGGAAGNVLADDAAVRTDAQGLSSWCRATCCPAFLSGLNVAWVNFARDIPNPALAQFTTLFNGTHDAGGRVIRWWLHTNGTVTPGYDANGMANKITDAQIADVRKVLDAALSSGVRLVISLWSFDMLQTNAMGQVANNKALLTDDAHRQAYIDNVLVPMVAALKGHPALYAWEAFNEPEGMTKENGWTPKDDRVDERFVQRTVNWFAQAIHDTDEVVSVTNGAWTFVGNSKVGSYQNFYSDEALRSAGGKLNGTLDFYQVHYYDNWGSNNEVVSPFKHAASYWKLDKPVVIGEFHAIDTNGVKANDLYTTLYDGGYAGAWAWQYTANDGLKDDAGVAIETKWPVMRAPMSALFSAHGAALQCP